MSRLMKGLLLLAICAGCSGDGSTLGPDGRPVDGDSDANGADDSDANGADDSDASTTDITLAQISEQIFALKCVGCHGGGSPSANMSLESGVVAAEIINVASSQRSDLKRIDPGNPDGSYLLIKLRADDGIVNQQMPLGGGALSDEQIEMVRKWIAGGAPVE